MNIYLPIEIKVRELEGKTLMALEAAERGHTVLLGGKEDTRTLAANGTLPPGIFHNKSITPSDKTISILDQLNENGHIVTCQDEESGLLDESFDEFANLRFSEESVSRTKRIFGWGPHDSQSLKRIYSDYKDHIVSTGSPRVDYWRSEFDKYYDLIVKGKLPEKKKPYILVSSNFGTILNENRFWDVIARSRKAGYFDRNPEWERHEYYNFAYQTKLAYEFVAMIRELSKAFPDYTILVRPHPTESVDGWKKLIGSYSNISVVREGAISGWIRNASVLVHNGCTTAIEAAAFNLSRIAYRPIPSEVEREIPNSVSYNAFSIEELKDIISKILNNKQIPNYDKAEEASKEVLASRFENLEGPLAAERIVDEWEEIGKGIDKYQLSNKELLDFSRISDDFLSEVKRNGKKFLKDNLFGKSKKSGSPLLKTKHKFPGLEEAELSELIDQLQVTLGRYKDVKTAKFGKRSFIVYKHGKTA